MLGEMQRNQGYEILQILQMGHKHGGIHTVLRQSPCLTETPRALTCCPVASKIDM
jgi:hypothetical protein